MISRRGTGRKIKRASERNQKVYRKHIQGAGAGTQTCSGSVGQPSKFNGPGEPTNLDKSHKRYDEANRGY